MPKPAWSTALTRLRRAARGGAAEQAPSDGWLLTRFLALRDEEAFAALVHRHGPMVQAVCRRVTADAHFADDAFQAAFLVLARRAADVQPRAAVRAWLYGVAVRTAREARSKCARLRAREVTMPTVPDRPDLAPAPPDADTLRALDEEIARLPAHLRTAVVFCELDGLSRKDASARLGIPEGTLSSRLGKARKVLACRLRGRGVALPAAGLTALGALTASAGPVQATLVEAAVKLAGSGPVPAIAAELSRGVFRTMLLSKLKWVMTALSLTVLVAGVSAWIALRPAHADGSAEKPVASPSVPPAAPPNEIFYSRDGVLYAVDAAGTKERTIDLPLGAGGTAVPSRDGRWLVYWTEADGGAGQATLFLRERNGREPVGQFQLPAGVGYLSFCWSPDGKQLHVNTGTPGQRGVQHYQIDVKAKQMSRLNVLKTHLVTDWSPDGRYFLTTEIGDGAEWEPKSLHFMNPDGTQRKILTRAQDRVTGGQLSPDGERALCVKDGRLSLLEVGKPEALAPVEGIPAKAQVVEYAWSPDGKRIVYTTAGTRLINPNAPDPLESQLVVADPDGKNARVLRSTKDGLITRAHWQ